MIPARAWWRAVHSAHGEIIIYQPYNSTDPNPWAAACECGERIGRYPEYALAVYGHQAHLLDVQRRG